MEQIHLTCIRCPRGCQLEVAVEDGAVVSVAGNACKRGETYAKTEAVKRVKRLLGSLCFPSVLCFVIVFGHGVDG